MPPISTPQLLFSFFPLLLPFSLFYFLAFFLAELILSPYPASLRHCPIPLLGSEGMLHRLASGLLKADVSFPRLSQHQVLAEERVSSCLPSNDIDLCGGARPFPMTYFLFYINCQQLRNDIIQGQRDRERQSICDPGKIHVESCVILHFWILSHIGDNPSIDDTAAMMSCCLQFATT